MNCKKCQGLLVDLIYDELSQRRKRAVEAHLKECPACARELESLNSTRRVFARLDEPAPPPEVETRIKAAAREEAEAVTAGSWWSIIFHPAFATAVLAFIAVGVVIFEMDRKPEIQKTGLDGLAKYRQAEKEEWEDKLSTLEYMASDEDIGGKGTVSKTRAPVPAAPVEEGKAKVKMAAFKDKAPPASPAKPDKAKIEVMVNDKNIIVVSAELAEEAPATVARAPEISERKDSRAKSLPGESLAGDAALGALPVSGARARGGEESRAEKKSYSPHVVTYSKESQLEKARDAEARDDWEGAKSIYSRTLDSMNEFDPLKAEVQFKLAVSHINLKEYKEAQALLEKLVREYPGRIDLDEALFRLADVYAHQGQIEKATAVCRQIKEMYPSRADEAQEKLKAFREEGKREP